MDRQTADHVTDNVANGLTSTNNNNNILSSETIGRKRFFLLTGIVALGTAILSAVPFAKSIAKGSSVKGTIKINPHPNAVSRNMNKEKGNG